jgi:hypothetical protein
MRHRDYCRRIGAVATAGQAALFRLARMTGAASVLLLIVALVGTSTASATVPFWGDTASLPVDTTPEQLAPGQFVWNPAAAPAGPIVVVVSLDDQRVIVYRNGIAIGWASASSGKPGHETPTGVFVILQKDKDHRSSIYNNAAMPYTQRLTWDGVALHAGGLPGYPSSHGCVHLPSAFAEALFAVSPMGMTVVVADTRSAPADVAHPPLTAPVDAVSGTALELPRLAPDQRFRWNPERAPEGPVTVLLSTADQRLLVLRNGTEIGRTRVVLPRPDLRLGSHVYVVSALRDGVPEWQAVGVPGHVEEAHRPLDSAAVAAIGVPEPFRAAVSSLLQIGSSLMVTDAPILPDNHAVSMAVLASVAE